MPPISDRGNRLRCVANTKRLRRLTRVAITAVVLMMAVTADLMLSPDPTARAVDAKAIRVTSSNLITDPGTGRPTVVLSLCEDSLCPYCRSFEQLRQSTGLLPRAAPRSGAAASEADRPGPARHRPGRHP